MTRGPVVCEALPLVEALGLLVRRLDSGATALQDLFPGGWFQPAGGLAWVLAELAMHPRKLHTDADQLIGRQTLSRFLKRTPECHSPAPGFSV